MTRNRIWAGALALTLVATAGACGGSEPADGGPVTLTLRQFDPPAETAGLQQALDAWNQAHPETQVEMETLSGADSMQQFAREANSGSGPDVVQIGFVNVKDLAQPKILAPVDDLMEQSPLDSDLASYLALDMNQFEGKTWALPWTVDTFAMAYNSEVLAEAGVDGPPTTWEELATQAATITEEVEGTSSGFCFAGSSSAAAGQWFAINYYLWSHGAGLVTEDGGTWRVGASEEQLTGALDYFNGLFTSGATAKSMAAVESINDPQIVDGVTGGSCAMTMMAPQTFRQARQNNEELKTAVMPDGLTDGSTHLGGRSLGINASSEHQEQAWELVKFLSSAEAFETIPQYPASSSVLSALDVKAGEDGYAEQLPHSRSFGRYIGGPVPVATLQKIVDSEFGAVYSGQKSSADAARSIVQQLEAELA